MEYKGFVFGINVFFQKQTHSYIKNDVYIKQQAGQMKQKEKRSRYCTKRAGLFFGEFQWWFLQFFVWCCINNGLKST